MTRVRSCEQYEELSLGHKSIVIEFWANWCGPCQHITPIFESLSDELEALEFLSVDVDDKEFGSQFTRMHGVRAMPTFQLIKNGVKVDELVGADPYKLETFLVNHSR